jgi:outer membrane protein TolC
MRTRHEPREGFVDELEHRIVTEARRRDRPGQPFRWMSWSPARVAVALGILIIASMAAGGAVVDAAYRSQNNERRDLVASTYERRIDLATQRLAIAKDELARTQRKVSLGVAQNTELLDSELRVIEAEVEISVLKLQLEEVRLSGQEPVSTVSAPLVQGRDFVSDRWQLELQVPQKAREIEQLRQRDAERRYSVGVADSAAVEVASAKVTELDAALQGLRQRLEIRKRFLGKQIDAAHAELLALESEAAQRQMALMPQLEMAKRAASRVAAMVQKGLTDELELAKANLALLSLEQQMLKANVDLTLIQKRLKDLRGK